MGAHRRESERECCAPEPERDCACASCAYTSAADRPSLQRLIAEGSKIDKLYLGKYIPLRERKLLDRLVRTRAVYDDIRNQLLSESEASMKEKPNLKPRKNQARAKDLKGNKSAAILELVDMVDQGNVPKGPQDLSECCSCCICGSKTHTYLEHTRARRLKQRMGEARRGMVGRGRNFAHKMSRTSTMMRLKMRDAKRGVRGSLAQTMSRASVMMKRRMGRRSEKPRAMSIMSEPCTCTYKDIGENIKHRSQDMVKRLRPRMQVGEQMIFEGVLSKKKPTAPIEMPDTVKKDKNRGKAIRKSIQTIRKSRDRLMESMEDAKRKIKQTEFHIRKDSIAKFKEKIRRRRHYRESRDYPCGCGPGTCDHEDCFSQVQARTYAPYSLRREKKQKRKSIEKNVGMTSSLSETGVQAQRTDEKVGSQKRKKTHTRGVLVQRKKKKGVPTEARISIAIGSKKKNVEVKEKAPKVEDKQLEAPVKKTSVKSMTKLSHTSSTGQETEQAQKIDKDVKTKKRRREDISFSIGSRKGKERKAAQRPANAKQEKKLTCQCDIVPASARGSQTKLKLPKKDAQIGSHALKRCFCTLKLKGKGYRPKPGKSISVTSETPSQTHKIQEKKGERIQTRPIKSRERACIDCSQDECDPRECYRKLKQQSSGPAKGTKFSASLESISVSTSSKSVAAHPGRKFKKMQKPSSEPPTKSDQEVEKTQVQEQNVSRTKKVEGTGGHVASIHGGGGKQAVRISSSFSFSIEFYREGMEKKTAGEREPREERTDHVVKRRKKGTDYKHHLRHKNSQMSSISGKSRFAITKHSLRRCFCTLKLNHPKRAKVTPVSRSTMSGTSRQKIPYKPDVNYDRVSIDKGVTTDNRKKHRLLPDECEPGVCFPGECDPYVCLEAINKRRVKHANKYSNTDFNRSNAINTEYRRTKSTSSIASRLVPDKAKKVQSSMGMSEKKHRSKVKALRQIKTSPSSPNRQVVRIGSSFSFNIEFYKAGEGSPTPKVVDIPFRPPSQTSESSPKRTHFKDRGFQDKRPKKHQKSTSMLVKKRNRGSYFAPISMKSQTKNWKEKKNIVGATIGTETPVENAVDYKNVMLTKGTRTKQDKQKHGYVLEPYECEPGVCIPGECDPYECLQRMRHLREYGITTDKAKMRSAISVTPRKKFTSKGALARSKLKGQGISAVTEQIEKEAEYYPAQEYKPQRQAVRIGSTFSFDIQFTKDKQQSLTTRDNYISEGTYRKPAKRVRHKGEITRDTSSSHQDSQASISTADKAAGIRPLLKRCFCTLKLQGNQNKKHKTNFQPPKVIAVSRVTVTETKINTHKNVFINNLTDNEDVALPSEDVHDENWAKTVYDVTSSSSQISKSSVLFRYKEMQSYFRKNCSKSLNSNQLSNTTLKTCFTKIDEKYAYSENCIVQTKNNERQYLKKRHNVTKYVRSRTHLKSLKSRIFSDPHASYPSSNKFKNRNYYIMNVHIPKRFKQRYKSVKCEQSIAAPAQCESYECQKSIMQRLVKSRWSRKITGKPKTVSSSNARLTPSLERLRWTQGREKVKKIPIGGMKLTAIPNRNKGRVCSFLSLTVDISKERIMPTSKLVPRRNIQEHETLQKTKYYDQDSQLGTDTKNPIIQGCFCTLKLEKKGKNQRMQHERALQQSLTRSISPDTAKHPMNSRTRITTDTTIQKLLNPYVFDPLVCAPGECGPYVSWLKNEIRNERIKNFDIGAIQYKGSARDIEKQTQVKLKKIKTKIKSSLPDDYPKAVRITSGYGFNEVCKNDSQKTQRKTKAARTTIDKVPSTKLEPQGLYEAKLIPCNSKILDKNKTSQSTNKKPFFEKYFCAIKKLKGFKRPKETKIFAQAGTETVSKPIVKYKKAIAHKFESPKGKHINKLLKTKISKSKTVVAHSDSIESASSSSNYSSQTSKAGRINSNFKTLSIVTKSIPSALFKEVRPVRHLSMSADRQVFRQQSSVRFSVDFCHDRSPMVKQKVEGSINAACHNTPRTINKNSTRTTEYENTRRSLIGTDKFYNCESQSDNTKIQNRSSGVGSMLKRCFCSLKLQKRKNKDSLERLNKPHELYNRDVNPEEYATFKTGEFEPGICVPYQYNPYKCGKLVKKRILKDTGVMTIQREKQMGLVWPYECETGVCVPGLNNSYKCTKLRKIKHRDADISTRNIRRKSVSSDMRSTIRSKSKRSQNKRRPVAKRSQSVSSKPLRTYSSIPRKSLDTSTRQSLWSDLGFDDEFYRDFSDTYADDYRIKPIKHRVRIINSISSSANQHLTETYSRKMQYHRIFRGTNPQIMQNTQYKLQQPENYASNYKFISKAARDRNVYLATLLPYECEPGVCIPGQCDPYECMKRIQRRLMRSQRTGTERGSQDSSTSSLVPARYRTTTSQSPRYPRMQRHQRGTYARAMREPVYVAPMPAPPRPVETCSASRQAVRLGSSFKFDIEFFKGGSPKVQTVRRETCIPPPKIRMHDMRTRPRRRRTRSISITSSDVRRRDSHMQTGPTYESKSSGMGRLKRCFCTLALHKRPPDYKTRSTFRNDDLSDLYDFSRNVGTGVRPRYPYKLLPYECEPGVCVPGSCDPYECYERIKRRMRDNGTGMVRPRKRYGSSITSRDYRTGCTNTECLRRRPRRDRPTMASFDEPPPRPRPRPIAIPTKICGDNRQAVRIGSNFSFSIEFYKERPTVKIPKAVYRIQEQEPEIIQRPRMRSMDQDSLTDRNYANRHAYAGRQGFHQKCQADCVKNTTRGTTMGAFLKRCFCTLNLQKNYKPHVKTRNPDVQKAKSISEKTTESPSKKHTETSTKTFQKSEKTSKKPPKPPKQTPEKLGKNAKKAPKKSPEIPPKKSVKQSKKAPETKSKKNVEKEEEPEAKKVATVQTQDKHPKRGRRYSLKPYECEPNVCVPGQCNPYECLERIRRRNLRQQDRGIGTGRRPEMSVGSMASWYAPRMSRRLQSGERKRRCHNATCTTRPRPIQEPAYVEEPRFAHVLEEMRTGVKIGSNVKFDVEFFKDRSQCPEEPCAEEYVESKPREVKVRYRDVPRRSTFSESYPTAMHRGVGDKCDNRTCEAQASGALMRDRGTGVNNILKRCFCTLKLQKKMHNVVTVNRLSIEETNPMIKYKQKHKLAKTVLKQQPLHNNDLRFKKKGKYVSRNNPHIKDRNCLSHDCNKPVKETKKEYLEMRTIYPYMPNKYNKNNSTTVLPRNLDTVNIIPAKRCYLTNNKLKANNSLLLNKIDKTRTTKEKSLKIPKIFHGEPSKSKNNVVKPNRLQTFKLFMRRLFRGKVSNNHKLTSSNDKPSERYRVSKNQRSDCTFTKQDVLKTSKSDRRPMTVLPIAKKTISLKLTKVPEKRKCYANNLSYRHNNEKYSRYQSGDTKQLPLKVAANEKNGSLAPQTVCCGYCQVFHGTDKIHSNSPYESSKFVQMALIKHKNDNKNRTKSTTTNADKKMKTQAVATNGPEGRNRSKRMKSGNRGFGDSDFCPCDLGTDRMTGNKEDNNFKSMRGKIKGSKICHCYGSRNAAKHDNKNDKELDSQNDIGITKNKRNGMNRKIYGAKGKINGFNGNINGADGKINSANDKIHGGNGKINRGKGKINLGNGKINGANGKINGANGKITGANGKMNGANGRINGANGKINGANGKINGVNGKPDGKPCVCPSKAKEEEKKLKREKMKAKKKVDKVKEPCPCPEKGKTKTVDFTGQQVTVIVSADDGSAIVGEERAVKEKGDAPDAKQDVKTSLCKVSCIKCLSSAVEVLAKAPILKKTGLISKLRKATGGQSDEDKLKTLGDKRYCVCGSQICDTEKLRMAEPPDKRRPPPGLGVVKRTGQEPCICGSRPCAEETEKQRKERKEVEKFRKNLLCACEAELAKQKNKQKKKAHNEKVKAKKRAEGEKEKAKKRAENEAKNKIAQKKMLKQWKLEDALRKKQRLKQDKLQEKEMKKYDKTGDGVLIAESILDLLKLGWTASVDTLRCAKRSILHPKHTGRSIKSYAKKPSRLLSDFGSAVGNSGVASTCRRVKARVKAMNCVKKTVLKLESFPPTRFLLYMCSKDAKKRLGAARARRMKRRRQPMDFECSLFMASLRRRPCLAVYYSCPWFYPHCLSMLNLWKQFTDIMLVLVAVAVWSPCVVLMEVCRAFVCCFFCTG